MPLDAPHGILARVGIEATPTESTKEAERFPARPPAPVPDQSTPARGVADDAAAEISPLEFSVDMDQLYDQTLTNMETSHATLAGRVHAPEVVPFGKDGLVFRYADKGIYQALIQKLARVVSGLHAARLLMEHGFFQEQAALQRMLDELNEDISFLALGVIFGNTTDLHQKYLAAFYEEEFDNPGLRH